MFFEPEDEIIPLINKAGLVHISFNLQDFKTGKNEIAWVNLKPIHTKNTEKGKLILLEGISADHKFINTFQRFNNKLREKLKKNKSGNVSLPGNLYEQVRIAYSIPRRISLISLSDGKDFNMFPTDLHGQLSDDLYVISLRFNGKASKQVETHKNITLSSIHLSFAKQAYNLGKNHMKELQPQEAFPAAVPKSVLWKSLLPIDALSYLELEKIYDEEPIIFGIHQLHFFRITQKHVVENESYKLSHIHNYYAQWRINNGLSTEFILR